MRTKGTIALFTLGSMMSAVATAQAQTVPVRELAATEAKSTQTFGNIFGLRQLAGGKVLVNDGIRRQLVMLDDKLSNATVVVDSASEGGQSYGPRPAPLIPYLADSTLFVDGTSLSLLVLDPFGKVAHVMSAPKPSDLRFLAGGASGVDGQGNLVYRGAMMIQGGRAGGPGAAPGAAAAPPQPPDSAPIIRANFETRGVDTIGRVKIQNGSRVNMIPGADGKPPQVKMTMNPLSTVDDWAVLSDGSVAFVRGHDYHIDWIRPDGSKFASAKLPFDWKRLTDDDKQKLIDSARTAMDKAAADARTAAASGGAAGQRAAVEGMAAAMGGGGGMTVVMRVDGGGGGGGGREAAVWSSGAGGPPGAMQMAAPQIDFVPLSEIADYYPAIRPGAAKADLDGNLWILPTTSAQAKQGELVYDVVNNKGELFQRVRLPLARSIAGFGKNGVVYLMSRDDATKTWTLERTRILNTTRATN